MEWTIPIQTLETAKVRLGPVSKTIKPMAPFSYIDDDIRFPSLSVLLPYLPLKSYEAETGKMVLSIEQNPTIYSKLLALQNNILQVAYTNHENWFPEQRVRSLEEFTSNFQPLIYHSCINLYCPSTTAGTFNEISIYSDKKGVSDTTALTGLQKGKQIRVAVRLQGISFHQHPVTKKWTGKSRIQHRILGVFL
jgi:hypothetical protein